MVFLLMEKDCSVGEWCTNFAALFYLLLFQFRLTEEKHAWTMVVNEPSQCDAQSTELVHKRFVKLFHRFLLSVPIWHKIIVLFVK